MRTPQAHGPGRRVDSLDDGAPAGSFEFVLRRDERTDGLIVGGMNYVCFGCKVVGHLPFRKPGAWPKQKNDWHWNGDRERPTLTPSIHHVGCWHGFLRGGVFTLA